MGIEGTDEDAEFIKIIKANDNGERWAEIKVKEIQEKNEPMLFSRIDEARVKIYADPVQKGDEYAQYMLGISLISIGIKMASATYGKGKYRSDESNRRSVHNAGVFW